MQNSRRPVQEMRERRMTGNGMENVLITGVTGGIGKELASELLEGGSSVIGLYRTATKEIKDLAGQHPGRLFLHEADLMDSENLGVLVKALVDEHGPIGGFVHCAGSDRMVPLHLTKPEDIEKLWRLHALAPMLMIAAISRKKNHMENMGIVLISSQSAHEGAMGHTAYAAAKGAVEGYLAPAAAELMEKGIRINEVCLAPVRTPMAAGWMDKLTDEGRWKLMESYPLGIGEARDVANLICFLLGKESRWINGQVITADGGHAVRKV